jgi:hypothetical protein
MGGMTLKAVFPYSPQRLQTIQTLQRPCRLPADILQPRSKPFPPQNTFYGRNFCVKLSFGFYYTIFHSFRQDVSGLFPKTDSTTNSMILPVLPLSADSESVTVQTGR